VHEVKSSQVKQEKVNRSYYQEAFAEKGPADPGRIQCHGKKRDGIHQQPGCPMSKKYKQGPSVK
jgi:hypothetical protein